MCVIHYLKVILVTMKISELRKILEHYQRENGDLEVRLVIDSHNGEEYNELINACIDTTQVYNEEEFNNLVNNMCLTEQQAFDNLKERGLAATYLDIYTYITG